MWILAGVYIRRIIRTYTVFPYKYVYIWSEWVVEKWPSTGLRDHKNPIFNNCFCGIDVSLVEVNPWWSNSSQWFDSKGFRSSSTRSTRVWVLAVHASQSPLKASRAEMMQDQKRHTFTHTCMHPPLHARTSAFTHPCTRTHTCTQTCVHRCTHKNTRTCEKVHARAFTHVRARTHTRMHVHNSARTQMYTHMHTPTQRYNHKQARAHAFSCTHTGKLSCSGFDKLSATGACSFEFGTLEQRKPGLTLTPALCLLLE